MNLKGKTAFVTGASAGIGEAIAYKFAEAGINLVLTARRLEKLKEIENNIKNKYHVNVCSIQLDVRNYDAVKKTIDSLPKEFSKIDILVNNAGLARGLSKLQEGDLQDWEEMIDTNVKGLLYVSRCILPQMVERSSGHVVNIGSIAGRQVYAAGNVYCGTKHAVKALSQGMTIDLNGTGVRVTEIAPGMVETEFSIVRFHGDNQKADNVYKGVKALTGEDIADVALYAVSVPEHIMIQEVVVTPTAQANATILCRK